MDKPREERSGLLDEYWENLERGVEQPAAGVDPNDAPVVARLVATLSPPQPETSFVEQLRHRILIQGTRRHGARSESWFKRQIRRTSEMVGAARPGAETRRPGNPWIRRMALAAVAVAALVVAAAVGANAERVSEAVGEAVGLRDDKNVYHTTSFEPAFSVTLPNNPSVDVAVDKSDAFLPGHSWSDYSGRRVISGPFVFGIYKPLGWADPAGEAPSPARGEFRIIIPGDIIAWLQAHPCLDAGEPESPVDIGGVEATQVDAAWNCATGAHSETLFYLEDPVDLGPESILLPAPQADSANTSDRLLPVNIRTDVRYRFWVLEVQGEDLVIVAPVANLAPPPVPQWDSISPRGDFERVVRPMLDSLTFD